MKEKKNLVNKPEEYWKHKIGFDIDKEFQIYQYLCGNLKSVRKIKKIEEDKRYKEYTTWHKHVADIIRKCDDGTLKEFFHFLKLQDMECDIDMGMHTSMVIPFFIALLVGELLQWILSLGSKITIQLNFNSVLEMMLKGVLECIFVFIVVAVLIIFFLIIVAVIVTTVMLPLRFVLKWYVRSRYMTAFWRDYLEIAKEVMNEKISEN